MRGCCHPPALSESAKPPKFDLPLQPAVLTEGDDLSLKCHVGGTPPLTVNWMKDRRELRSDPSTKITFVSGTPWLQISQVGKSAAGDYLCKASNSAGTDFCKAKVTVKGIWMKGWRGAANVEWPLPNRTEYLLLLTSLPFSGQRIQGHPRRLRSCRRRRRRCARPHETSRQPFLHRRTKECFCHRE